MSNRKYVAISIILIATLGLVALVITPGIFFTSNLVISAEAFYWQNFMPVIPEGGPSFYMVVYVNISNIGSDRITGFEIPRATVYYYGTKQLLVTLSLHQVTSTWSEVGPGECVLVQLTNDRDTVFSPIIEERTLLFSQVLLRCENIYQTVLTTPSSELLHIF